MAETLPILSPDLYAAASFRPDLSLIHDYTSEDEHTFHPVAITHFHRDNKDLYYVSTHHELGTQSTTSKAVRQAMEQYNPQLAIIEGLQTQKGMSPAFYAEYAKHHAADNFTHAEEPAYAAYLAGQKNIPFVGGEPSEPQIFKEMEGKGYSAKDVMAFYLLRNIPVWRRDGELNKEHFDRQASEYLNLQMFDFIPKEKRLTLNEFKAWYDAHKPENKSFLDIGNHDAAPLNSPDATYFQRLNSALDRVRNTHIVNTISDAFARYDKVLVVYGNGHLTCGHPVLEKMFGEKGETIQFVPDKETDKEPASNTPSVQSTSILPKLFKYGSAALAASSIIAGAFTLPMLAVSLLAAAALSFGAGKVTEIRERVPSAQITYLSSSPDTAASNPYQMPSHRLERSDGKTWAEASQAKQPVSLSRA